MAVVWRSFLPLATITPHIYQLEVLFTNLKCLVGFLMVFFFIIIPVMITSCFLSVATGPAPPMIMSRQVARLRWKTGWPDKNFIEESRILKGKIDLEKCLIRHEEIIRSRFPISLLLCARSWLK